jgi:hypothetical protein
MRPFDYSLIYRLAPSKWRGFVFDDFAKLPCFYSVFNQRLLLGPESAL